MKKNIKLISFLICTIVIISLCSVFSFAETKSEGNAVIPCAHKGNWNEYPENSLEAVLNAQCEWVSVDIKITKDGIPVLMEDETVERTCVDKEGKTVKGRVSDYNSEEICSLYLRNKNGGPHNKKTEIKVPTLEEVIKKAEGKTLILDFSLSDFNAVYKTVYSLSAQSKVIFRIDGKADDVSAALSEKKDVPESIIKYDGNIIFGVNKAINVAAEAESRMVQLGDKNQYGVIFYGSVENKIKKANLTAVFSMTDEYSAKRGDNVTGWDDVISHGYSVIETDYPELFNDYVESCNNIRSKLTSLMKASDEYAVGTYPQNLIEEYSRAYSEAENALNKPSSQSQLAEAFSNLNSAFNALNLAEGASTHEAVFKFSVGRIITVVLCLAAVIAAQVFFYKRRKNK